VTTHHYYANIDLMTHTHPFQGKLYCCSCHTITSQCVGMLQASYQQPISSSLSYTMLRLRLFSMASVGGKRLPLLQSPAFEWVCDWVRVIASLHHAIDKVEKPLLDGIRHHNPDRPITYQSLSHLFSFFSLLFLGPSQSTISLQLLPTYAARNKTSIFVASYRSYRAQSPDPGFPPHQGMPRLLSHHIRGGPEIPYT